MDMDGLPLEEGQEDEISPQGVEEFDPQYAPEEIIRLEPSEENDLQYTSEEIHPLDSSDEDSLQYISEEILTTAPSIEDYPQYTTEEILPLELSQVDNPQYTTEEILPLELSQVDNPQYTSEEILPLESAEDNLQYTNEEIRPLELLEEDEQQNISEEILPPGPAEEIYFPDAIEESHPPVTFVEFNPLRSSEGIDLRYSSQEINSRVSTKKIALILSGGGARGAFQVGAEMYARQVMGYHWDIIAGVSVGAMNGAMLAMHRYARLLEIWDSISNDQVYTGGFNLPSLVKLLLGAKSFYGNQPLQKMMKHELEAGKVIEDLHVGAVSLLSGEYVQFTRDFLELPSAILASSSIPVIWPPVDVSSEHIAMVDGGVRNNSPVGDVLELEPDEIVIINCSKQAPSASPNAAANVLSIGMRSLDIMQNEIFVSDIKEFLRINALVREAEEQGVTLHHPRTGRVLKYYPYVLIEPETDLGETLDFSRGSVQASLRAGVKRARAVLGRP
jgi:NTE family protein